jgi:hypothetical protein
MRAEFSAGLKLCTGRIATIKHSCVALLYMRNSIERSAAAKLICSFHQLQYSAQLIILPQIFIYCYSFYYYSNFTTSNEAAVMIPN